jgi:hypothetical protein
VHRKVVHALLRLLLDYLEIHIDVQILQPLHPGQRLIDRHRPDRHRRVPQDGVPDLRNLAARRKIHHRVGPVLDRCVQLPQLFLNFRSHRRVSDVRVHLAPRRDPNPHRLQLRVIDVRRNDQPSRRHLVAHQLQRQLLPLRHKRHLLGRKSLPRKMHLRHVRVAASCGLGLAPNKPVRAWLQNFKCWIGSGHRSPRLRAGIALRLVTEKAQNKIIDCNDLECPEPRCPDPGAPFLALEPWAVLRCAKDDHAGASSRQRTKSRPANAGPLPRCFVSRPASGRAEKRITTRQAHSGESAHAASPERAQSPGFGRPRAPAGTLRRPNPRPSGSIVLTHDRTAPTMSQDPDVEILSRGDPKTRSNDSTFLTAYTPTYPKIFGAMIPLTWYSDNKGVRILFHPLQQNRKHPKASLTRGFFICPKISFDGARSK